MLKMLGTRTGRIILGLVVSIGIIAWLAAELEWSVVIDQFGKADYRLFIPVTLIVLIQFVLRSWRWRYLLPRDKHISLKVLFDGLMLGNFGNFILPLRAGEFMRPYIVMKESGYSFPVCFLSVVVERFFDLSMVLVLFCLMMLSIEGIDPCVYYGAAGLSMVAVTLLVFILLGALFPDRLERLSNRILVFLPATVAKPFQHLLDEFFKGVGVLRDGRSVFAVLGLSLLIWLSTIWQYSVMLSILDLPMDFLFGLSITVILALGVALPSAPGFIGPFEGAVTLTFPLFGQSSDLGFTYAVLAHIHQYLMIILLGVWVVFKYGLKFNELRSDTQTESESESKTLA
jgi:uncharacterized protein (TIRG00374 family)